MGCATSAETAPSPGHQAGDASAAARLQAATNGAVRSPDTSATRSAEPRTPGAPQAPRKTVHFDIPTMGEYRSQRHRARPPLQPFNPLLGPVPDTPAARAVGTLTPLWVEVPATPPQPQQQRQQPSGAASRS